MTDKGMESALEDIHGQYLLKQQIDVIAEAKKKWIQKIKKQLAAEDFDTLLSVMDDLKGQLAETRAELDSVRIPEELAELRRKNNALELENKTLRETLKNR